ncbi:MAG: LysM peptidoglycan-binding domain-containing protein [Cyclobacteriaceae bacterium]|nr:LysM peptidoglycan-binding domain-containing protein [Cyclobacteriaceae bacterium]
MRNFLMGIVLLVTSGPAPAQGVSPDSLPFPWIHRKANVVQFFHPGDLKSFYERWISKEGISVAHFGDSHIQSDIYTGETRRLLQEARGDAGRGMIFPYSAARTHSTIDYSTYHRGKWTYAKNLEYVPRLPLGITGATIRTTDSTASFKIIFKDSIPSSYRKLRIFAKAQRSSFDLVIRTGGNQIEVPLDESAEPFVSVDLPSTGSALYAHVKRRHSWESELELYGLSLESVDSAGVIYHSMGISGSQFGSLLSESLFEAQLPLLHPDLVVLDFGTNDYLIGNHIPAEMETRILAVIARVRRAAPGASILLTSTQDMNRRGRNITAGKTYSDLIRRIAREQHCLFYDWYWISGGPQTMIHWYQNGLAQRDMIHLTMSGYILKGKLLAEALQRSLQMFRDSMTVEAAHVHPDSLAKTSMPLAQFAPARSVNLQQAVPTHITDGKVIMHRIERGETLGGIARMYGVTVSQIMAANDLYSTRITAGKLLRIEASAEAPLRSTPTPVAVRADERKTNPQEKKKPATTQVVSKPANSTPVQQVSGETIHQIQSGETLGAIAAKYHVTIQAIKDRNGLKTSRIVAGKTLFIPKAK